MELIDWNLIIDRFHGEFHSLWTYINDCKIFYADINSLYKHNNRFLSHTNTSYHCYNMISPIVGLHIWAKLSICDYLAGNQFKQIIKLWMYGRSNNSNDIQWWYERTMKKYAIIHTINHIYNHIIRHICNLIHLVVLKLIYIRLGGELMNFQNEGIIWY